MCFPQYKNSGLNFHCGRYKSWAALNLYVFNCVKLIRFIFRQGLTAQSEFPLNSWAQMILRATLLCFWHYRNAPLAQA